MGHGSGASAASLLALSPHAEGLFQVILPYKNLASIKLGCVLLESDAHEVDAPFYPR